MCVCFLLFRTPEILTNILLELMSLATCPSNFAKKKGKGTQGGNPPKATSIVAYRASEEGHGLGLLH